MTLFYANQYITTTLSKIGGLNSSETAGIVLASVSGIDITKPSIALLTYSDPIDTSKCEWISYTSINGSNELVGVIRNSEGMGSHPHNNGCAIAFPVSASHINNINDLLNGITSGIRPRKRIYSTTSTATLTPEISTYDVFRLTAQSAALTIANHSTSTPNDGDMMLIDIMPDATPRAITHGDKYQSYTGTLLTTTTASKGSMELFQWSSAVSKWLCLTAQTQS